MCTGTATQIAALNQRAHPASDMAELIVVTGGNLQALFIGERDKCLSFVLPNGEGLFHINVAAAFQAQSRDVEMALRRSGDVNDVWFGFVKKLL